MLRPNCQNFAEIISRTTPNSRNSGKFWPTKYKLYTLGLTHPCHIFLKSLLHVLISTLQHKGWNDSGKIADMTEGVEGPIK